MSKTTSITVERNYRIDNSDQYMKARLSHSLEPEEGETKEEVTLRGIKEMDNIFRIAYPHVEEHLNFYIVRQVNEDKPVVVKDNQMTTTYYPNGDIKSMLNKSVKFNGTITPEPTIGKGTIEDQIQACTTIEQLQTFKLIADMNDKLKTVYGEKFISISNHGKSLKKQS